jgi:hypothetical protein
LLKPIETQDFLDEFPAIGTGNFLFQTGKTIALTANGKMSACWREAGHLAVLCMTKPTEQIIFESRFSESRETCDRSAQRKYF